MNLIEAVKSGRPFKRTNGPYGWIEVDGDGIFMEDLGDSFTMWIPGAEDIGAEDYELEPVKKEFTLNEILETIRKLDPFTLIEESELKVALGFEEPKVEEVNECTGCEFESQCNEQEELPF